MISRTVNRVTVSLYKKDEDEHRLVITSTNGQEFLPITEGAAFDIEQFLEGIPND